LRDVSYQVVAGAIPALVPLVLSEEHLVIALSAGIDGDVATAVLLGWPVQDGGLVPVLWTAALDRHDGDWFVRGLAGGLPPADYPLSPSATRVATLPGPGGSAPRSGSLPRSPACARPAGSRLSRLMVTSSAIPQVPWSPFMTAMAS
jgi:hypothetical protein